MESRLILTEFCIPYYFNYIGLLSILSQENAFNNNYSAQGTSKQTEQ